MDYDKVFESTLFTQVTQGGLGNTNNPPLSKQVCKLNSRSRKWCLTINNYSEDKITQLHKSFELCKNWIIGEEKGEEGTPHLQIFVEWQDAKSFKKMKKLFPRAHIEKAKGSLKRNYEYCSKEGKFTTNIDLRTPQEKLKDLTFEQEYSNVKWHKWQQEILDMIEEKPDKRKIYWFYESKGNVGKSYLCKYIAIKKDVIICEGKKDNIFNQVAKKIEDGKQPTIILCDVPRTTNEYLNYGALEQLKNGMLYSGKYEGGQCIFPIPHVICFSNEMPNKLSMSRDRWEIREL